MLQVNKQVYGFINVLIFVNCDGNVTIFELIDVLPELFRLTDNRNTKILKITNNTDWRELVLKAKKIEDKPRDEYSNLFTRLFDFIKKYIVEIAKHPNSAPAKFGLPRVKETDLYGLAHFIGSELKYCK